MSNPAENEAARRFFAQELSRRRLVKTATAATAAAAFPVATTAVRPAAAAPRAQIDADTLVIADNMSDGGLWLTLDPAIIYEVNPGPLMNVVYETLYHMPDSAEPDRFEPLLADGEPEVSADGTEATIRLRQGVTFHTTGNPVTADDWVFSLNRTRSLKGSPSYLAEYWDSVEAVDPQSLKFTLPAPNPALVAILTSTPLAVTDSAAVRENGGTGLSAIDAATPGAEAADSATDWFNSNSAGTGPYRIAQWDPSTEVIIERNPDYWGDAGTFERIIWRNVVGANEQLQAVQGGEADIAFSLDPDAVESVRSDPALQLLEGETISLHYLAMHTQEDPGGPLANPQLRQAIASAVDYQGIIDGLLAGAAVRPATVVPIPFAGTETVLADAYQTDLARAQELFDASGLGPTTVTLSFRAAGDGPSGLSEDTLATKLQSDLQQIDGLTVELEPMDSNTWIADYRAGKLQFTIAPWGPDYPDIQSYTEPFGRSGEVVATRIGYENPELDAILDQIIAAPDQAAKEPLYVQAQQILIEDAPYVVLYQPSDRKAASAAVQGVTLHFLYSMQLRRASKTAA